MLTLGIDTSTPWTAVAIGDDNGRGQMSQLNGANQSGEYLAAMVAQIFDHTDWTITDVNAVGVGLGPGPFTGLRVGIVFAAALGDALGIPAYGFCSLDAIATGRTVPCVAMSDARRKEVYWARYDSARARIDGPHVTKPAELLTQLTAGERLVGPGAKLYQDVFGPLLDELDGLPPSAGYLADQAMQQLKRGATPAPLTPLYLRRPDADESFTAKSVLT